jgi:hypothetical protein
MTQKYTTEQEINGFANVLDSDRSVASPIYSL